MKKTVYGVYDSASETMNAIDSLKARGYRGKNITIITDKEERLLDLDKEDSFHGDIKEAGGIFKSASFDVITCNPPYMMGQHGLTNPDAPKAIARHEILCTLEDVVSQAAKLLRSGGHFYMVHRPFRLAEIITTLVNYKLEPKRMQLVYPFVDKEPNMVLIEAVRGGKSRMTVEKPLIVYKEPGVYMPEIYDIYGY